MGRVPSRVLGAVAAVLLAASAAEAQDRECWICGSSVADATITGPTSVRSGEVRSWTGTARWTFDYDLRPGETITLSALGLTFEEFTPPDDYYPADVTPFTSIVCEPDCAGTAAFVTSFTVTGAFDPPSGSTTQTLYLIPIARMTSIHDPHTINIYDFPIAVPRITITVTEVPEPAVWAMLVAGFFLAGAPLRRRLRRSSPARFGPGDLANV